MRQMVKKNLGNRLEPLNAKIENNALLVIDERKLFNQLNPLPNKHGAAVDQKRVRSKIPVLQKKAFFPKQKKEDVYCDASISAADRRQKFQQSRLHGVGVGNLSIDPVLKKQPTAQYCCDVFPWYEGYILHKVLPPSAYLVNPKNVLPPIKPVDVPCGSLQKINQTKSKCLLGEFTHFPALCNPASLKDRKHYTSTVPHLPPIMPSPPAPPPSISNSLEKDRNHVNKNILGNKWNSCRPAFQSAIPV